MNALVERGGAGSDADPGNALEPLFADVVRAFDVSGLASELTGSAGELSGVVGVFSSDGQYELDRLAEFVERGLPVFGGVADGIIVDDFGFGALFANFADESADTVNGLGGLGDDAEAFDMRETGDVIRMKNDASVGKVSLKAADFDMSGFAHDDRLVAFGYHFGELGVCDPDKRAGGVGDLVAGLVPAFSIAVRCSVSGNDDVLGGSGFPLKFCGSCPLGCETGFYGGIVGELAEDASGSLRE